MQKKPIMLTTAVIVAVLLSNSKIGHAETGPFGDSDNVAFAEQLWQEMERIDLVGNSAKTDQPYKGVHPHGAVLETLTDTLTVDGHEGVLLVKRNYGGAGASIDGVDREREKFIKDVTVMFQRENGYDDDNQNWFWAKFDPTGQLEINPRGKKLAGRIAKGKSKGCIACHKGAPGGDYLFVK